MVAATRLTAQGRFAAAEEYLLDAAKSLRRTGAPSRPERAVVWNALGIVCKYLGKFRSAERYYQQALGHARYLPPGLKRDQFVADLYHNLGGLEYSKGRFARAERYARKGLRLRLESSDTGTAIASDWAALAAILDGLGRTDESERLYHRALRIYRKQFGADHQEIAVILNNLGALHQTAGRPRQAAYYYGSALRMKCRVLSNSHPDIALTMNNLATLCYAQDRLAEARVWLRQALRLARVSLGPSHPVSRTLQCNSARISSCEGRSSNVG